MTSEKHICASYALQPYFYKEEEFFCEGRARGADAEDSREGSGWGGDFGQVNQ